MDDLLDLNWSAPASKQPAQKPEKPKDAFADLLSTTPKPVDISKLSLLERQKLQQQQQQQQSSNTSSPWLTPAQVSSPVSRTATPLQPTSSPAASFKDVKQQAVTTNTTTNNNTSSSFESLLDPFGSSSKKQNQDRNTPLNQLLNQSNSATPVEQGQWDFDFLDTKSSHLSTQNNSTSASVLDPFDMDSLAQQTRSPPSAAAATLQTEEDEDDNPLGILAQPAIKSPTPQQVEQETEEPIPASPQQSEREVATDSPMESSGRIMLDEDEEDAMLAQLIDMGFSLKESKFAVEATAGQDLQAAIDILVQNSETVQRQQPAPATNNASKQPMTQNERARRALFSENESVLSSSQQPTRQKPAPREAHDDPLQETTEKIVSQAQELGGFLYKNATSYLKAGREKVTKAVGDWQEQQRAHRLQEGQSGPVRPKWMTESEDVIDVSSKNVEKFADDDDSEDEAQHMEADIRRRREEEETRRKLERRQQEQAAAAHNMRQQQKLRKDTLIDDEQETYVSPSRRRGGSGRSTPRSTASPQTQQQQPPQKTSPRPQQHQKKPASPAVPKNTRTRPVVNASPDVMNKANEARSQGNEKFKLGQFGEAEEAYTRAIDILPAEHDHQVLLCNNRAMARLKIGNYKKCVEDCDTALALAKQSGDGSTTSEGVVIQWRDQIVKSLSRKAEALENIEKYKDALAVYDELVKYEGGSNLKANQGMARCRQALNPQKKMASKPKEPAPQTSQQSKKDDFISMFDPHASKPAASIPTVSAEELGKSKAVAAMRAKAAEQEAEDAEKLQKTDDVNARLLAWKAGKEKNLRALLATLDTLLWPGAQWKGAQISELIDIKKCKITYMKAIGKVHPDKLPSDVTVEQRMLASGIFAALNEAWDSFKEQNQM